MISEKDKQAILNGSFGVSRDGGKCKFIGKLDTPDLYNYFFVYFNKVGITNYESLNEDFLENSSSESPLDVVGLWENRQEPFNLDKALQGEPVKLRDGKKAFVKYVMPPEYKGKYPIRGYTIDPNIAPVVDSSSWTIDGKAFITELENGNDIVSMWTDLPTEPRQITVNLPSALKEPKDQMWFIAKNGIFPSSYSKNIPEYAFLSRPYFGSEQDAKAWWEAMMNSRGI